MVFFVPAAFAPAFPDVLERDPAGAVERVPADVLERVPADVPERELPVALERLLYLDLFSGIILSSCLLKGIVPQKGGKG